MREPIPAQVRRAVLLALTIGRHVPQAAEEEPIPTDGSARDSLEALDTAIRDHIARSNALWEASHWVLVDAQDGGEPTREHLRALWDAYMAFRAPEGATAEGGGAREDAGGVDRGGTR